MWIKDEVSEVCVDDFAIRKRHTYGTIMVDIQTHRVIDLIPYRETGDVTTWLKEYPNLKVVSRDGSVSYASAIRQANPEIIQVSDRFHLIKGLSDACKKQITQLVTANFRIPKAGSHYEGETDGTEYWEKKTKPDAVTMEHEKNLHKKEKLVEYVRSLDSQGVSQMEIASELGISRTTVWRYLKSGFNPESAHYDQKHASKIKPYEETIKNMLSQKKTFKEIEQKLKENGYKGAASTIRMYATRERKLAGHVKGGDKKNTELIERKWLIKLLYKPMDRQKGINEEQLKQVINGIPLIGQLYDLMGSFKETISAKKAEELDKWIEEAKSIESEEITGFINGIIRDKEAVKNAIRYDYNNGLAEGSVNKLKVSKRIMYGRCSFDTLKKKLLLREKYRNYQRT